MMNINRYQKAVKNFLDKRELNLLMNEVFSKMEKSSRVQLNTKNKKNIDFLKNRKKFDNLYFKLKKSKNWSKFYKSLVKLKFYKKVAIPNVKKHAKSLFNKKCKVVNFQLRIIEKSDRRSYPIHQELMNNKKILLTYWIALHEIKKKEGGLLISKDIPEKKIKHVINKMGYPILKNQKKWLKQCCEKSFKAGEVSILGQLVPHGTAPKFKSNPRWALIIRTTI